ncbi:MAG TPA: hypothetical protein VIM15_04215 [Gemmatimonadaceae bacterium]
MPALEVRGFARGTHGRGDHERGGPIRQLVQGESKNLRRYLVNTTGTAEQTGEVVQVQMQ